MYKEGTYTVTIIFKSAYKVDTGPGFKEKLNNSSYETVFSINVHGTTFSLSRIE